MANKHFTCLFFWILIPWPLSSKNVIATFCREFLRLIIHCLMTSIMQSLIVETEDLWLKWISSLHDTIVGVWKYSVQSYAFNTFNTDMILVWLGCMQVIQKKESKMVIYQCLDNLYHAVGCGGIWNRLTFADVPAPTFECISILIVNRFMNICMWYFFTLLRITMKSDIMNAVSCQYWSLNWDLGTDKGQE